MFQNYSQTYAANITVVAGWIVLLLNHYGHSIGTAEVSFIIGNLLNLGGALWVFMHRHSKGDVSVGGFRH